MSKKLPSYREKQRILYIDHRSERDLIAYGDSFLEAGKISDAIEFYQKANYTAGLEKIRSMAEQSGDVMLFQQVLKPLKQHASDEAWNEIGRRALDSKNYAFALHAFENGHNITMVEQIRKIITSRENEQIA